MEKGHTPGSHFYRLIDLFYLELQLLRGLLIVLEEA